MTPDIGRQMRRMVFTKSRFLVHSKLVVKAARVSGLASCTGVFVFFSFFLYFVSLYSAIVGRREDISLALKKFIVAFYLTVI
jgi:hypothetical protein